MSNSIASASGKRKLFAPLVLAAGVLATASLAFSMSPAFAGFTASINNSSNSIGSGTLLMSETQGATTCLSSASGTVTVANAGTCSTINKFNGTTAAAPGVNYTSTITIRNNGTVPANTFTLTPSGCTQSNNGAVNGVNTNFCSKVNITINDDTNSKCVFPASQTTACSAPTNVNNLTTLGTNAIALAVPLAPGASRSYTFTVAIDAAGSNNGDQGLLATEALNWAFAS